MSELFRVLGALVEPPSPETAVLAELVGLPETPSAREYTELFQLNLYPYASVYLGNEAVLGGEASDRIAGFWRAIGLVPPAEPDHLALMLGLYASLGDDRRAAHARRAFLWEHLLSWLPPYLDKMIEVGTAAYREWASVLGASLEVETKRHPFDGRVPLHLREASPLSDPRASGLADFLTALLSPVRSGLILVRADLQRASCELELGLRVGERRFALRSLLEQDAALTLSWLGAEALRWEGRHRRRTDSPLSDFWAGRARRSAALLRELTRDARIYVSELAAPPRGSGVQSHA